MKNPVFIFFFSLSLASYAQQSSGEGVIMRKLAQVPDTAFRSTSSFSNFLLSEFTGDEEILTAIYTWIGKSVSYDIEKMYNSEFEQNPVKLIETTFISRRAVCQGYCELFHDLCRKTGITSFVIHGYTKQDGEIKNAGHAWIVVVLGNTWYGIDPTWGAGYIQDGRFVRSFSYDYFLVNPEDFITSHMPFDPMWQCLEFPCSIEEFYNGERIEKAENEQFVFADSIRTYMQLPVITQYEITLHRIRQNGIRNSLIRDYAYFLNQTIENDRLTKVYEYQSRVVEQLNEAAGHYNNAANLFNDYILYYNRQFRSALSDSQVQQMIDTCDIQNKIARQMIAEVEPFDQKISQNRDQLKLLIRDLQYNIEKQKSFVIKYIKTPKGNRALLFRRQADF